MTCCSSAQQPARPFKAMAFDVDQISLARLRELLAAWQIEAIYGATAASLPCDWNPAAVDLQIVGVCADLKKTLALCRFLSQSSRRMTGTNPRAPLESASHGTPARVIVLMPREQREVIGAVYAAGAYRCLMLPLREHALADVVTLVRAARRKERAAQFERERVQDEGRWYDEGGQGYGYTKAVLPADPAYGGGVPSPPSR